MISENHTICLYDGVAFISINHHDQDFHVLLYIIPQYYSTKTPTTYNNTIKTLSKKLNQYILIINHIFTLYFHQEISYTSLSHTCSFIGFAS